MESGYNTHVRLSEAHFGGDALFNHDIPYGSSPSGYYNSTPPIKPRSNTKGDASHFLEFNAEDSLARKLSFLTSSLTQGKPIIVEDLMSLRTDNEVFFLKDIFLKILKTEQIFLSQSCFEGNYFF